MAGAAQPIPSAHTLSGPTSHHNLRLFLIVTVLCVSVAVVYTLYSARSARSFPVNAAPPNPPPVVTSSLSAATPSLKATPDPSSADAPAFTPLAANAAATDSHSNRPVTVDARPYVVAINVRDSPDLGMVEFADLESIDNRTTTRLRCERMYFAAGKGICLSREVTIFSAQTIATLVDATYQPFFSVRADGIPSRARISPDGRYAAFTVFVTGHSYADAQLSTATFLIDINTRTTLGNLEEFEVFQSGKAIKSPDFNYWGVTFERDSNFFYATLRTGGVNYLVRGDIGAKQVSVVYKGIECPSLSPDGTRVAFKRMISRGEWRLAVLSLTTLQETLLSETRSVDDQVEWLDDQRVLYGLVDASPWMSIMSVAADGSGVPEMFAKGAASPAVVRAQRYWARGLPNGLGSPDESLAFSDLLEVEPRGHRCRCRSKLLLVKSL